MDWATAGELTQFSIVAQTVEGDGEGKTKGIGKEIGDFNGGVVMSPRARIWVNERPRPQFEIYMSIELGKTSGLVSALFCYNLGIIEFI